MSQETQTNTSLNETVIDRSYPRSFDPHETENDTYLETATEWAYDAHGEAPVDAIVLDETHQEQSRDPNAIKVEVVTDANIAALRDMHARDDRKHDRQAADEPRHDSAWRGVSVDARREGYTPITVNDFDTVLSAVRTRQQRHAESPAGQAEADEAERRESVIERAKSVIDTAYDNLGANQRTTYILDTYYGSIRKSGKIKFDEAERIVTMVDRVTTWRDEAQAAGQPLDASELRSKYLTLWHAACLDKDPNAKNLFQESEHLRQLTDRVQGLLF